jgi:hypothetical protein
MSEANLSTHNITVRPTSIRRAIVPRGPSAASPGAPPHAEPSYVPQPAADKAGVGNKGDVVNWAYQPALWTVIFILTLITPMAVFYQLYNDDVHIGKTQAEAIRANSLSLRNTSAPVR